MTEAHFKLIEDNPTVGIERIFDQHIAMQEEMERRSHFQRSENEGPEELFIPLEEMERRSHCKVGSIGEIPNLNQHHKGTK